MIASGTIEDRKQSGVVLVAFLLLLVTGASFVFLRGLNAAATQSYRDAQTASALAEAKAALIGRAATDNDRPGTLPCPDLDNDGSAELFTGADCPAYMGRLPWRTLRLSDIRGGSDERLWYVLSPAYRDHPSAQPINSNTLGTLDVSGTVTANDVLAIVIAPGITLGGQERNSANINNVLHYLEESNSDGDNDFVAASLSETFNDQLTVLTWDSLLPTVERRVAGELRNVLNDYFANSSATPSARYYPYAASSTIALTHVHWTNDMVMCPSQSDLAAEPLLYCHFGSSRMIGTPLLTMLLRLPVRTQLLDVLVHY